MTAFESATGKGVTGVVNGRRVAVGSPRYLQELGIDPGALDRPRRCTPPNGQSVVFVAVDGQAAGLLGVADPVKSSAREAVETLHREGLKVIMLTGDNRITAEAVAAATGIDQVQAEVLPDGKVRVVLAIAAAR